MKHLLIFLISCSFISEKKSLSREDEYTFEDQTVALTINGFLQEAIGEKVLSIGDTILTYDNNLIDPYGGSLIMYYRDYCTIEGITVIVFQHESHALHCKKYYSNPKILNYLLYYSKNDASLKIEYSLSNRHFPKEYLIDCRSLVPYNDIDKSHE